MTAFLKKITSLSNLKSAPYSGQIATLLILMIVGMLILILVTVNIGQVSVTATSLSNTADSCALSLASQLATRADMVFSNMDRQYKKCKTGGMASSWTAALTAIVAVIVTIYCPVLAPYAFWIITAAGALGGWAGAEMAGTDRTQGLVIGAGIGMAIAGGWAQFGNPTTTVGSTTGTSSALSAEAAEYGFGLISPGEAALAVPAYSGVTIVIPSTLGTIAGVGLAAGLKLNEASVTEKDTSNAFSNAQKAVNGIIETDRYRESIFLQALLSTVDDPNKSRDDGMYEHLMGQHMGQHIRCGKDLDTDGQESDEVLHFYKWWDIRVSRLKEYSEKIKASVNAFLDGPVTVFRDFCYKEYNITKTPYEEARNSKIYHGSLVGPLCRNEIESKDGVIVELFRDYEIKSSDQWIKINGINLWDRGPDKQPLKDYNECSCGDSEETEEDDWQKEDTSCCQKPLGFDSVDEVISGLQEFVSFVDELKRMDRRQVLSSWESWFNLLYSSSTAGGYNNEDGCYYSLFNDMIKLNPIGEEMLINLNVWEQQIELKRKALLPCTFDVSSSSKPATNYPCRMERLPFNKTQYSQYLETNGREILDYISRDSYGNKSWATSDRNIYDNDEFIEAILAIRELKAYIADFCLAIKAFDEKMKNEKDGLYTNFGINEFGGINPIKYTWNDSRGQHEVEVEVSDYKIAWVDSVKSGNCGWKCKRCIHLMDYSDSGENTWVKITRRDPVNKESGIAGLWNAYTSPDGKMTISRKAKAYYSIDKVGLAKW